MGVVYLGTRSDNEFHKHVAIKILQNSVQSEEMLRRFRQERQILASLEHPNIARLIDGGTTDAGEPYFVMEYISGGLPLDRYCEDQQLTLPQKLKLFMSVCSAVQYAHQRLVVHRDLKPGNILVSPEGVVKLLDFGIAKALFPQFLQADAALTQTGLHAMTPEYASPEQMRGDAIGVASDIYTLGVVLYQLLTGRLPFHQNEGGLPEFMRVVCEQEPRKPSTVITPVKKELAGDLDNIVLMAMRKEPERRYGSAEQLGEDIRRYLEGMPVSARAATAGYRASKFLKRHTYAAVAVGLFLASLTGGIVTTVRQARIAQANAARAKERFEDLRQLAGKFLFEIEHEISPLPGSTNARKKLVAMAHQYLEILSRERGDDVDLADDLAKSYAVLGSIQRSRNKHSLGDSAGARVSYLRALDVCNSVLTRNGPNAKILYTKAKALAGMGDITHLDGNFGATRQYYLDALAAAEQSVALGGDKAERILLAFYGKLAELDKQLGNDTDALIYYRKAYELTAALVKQSPDDYTVIRSRHVSISQLGGFYLKTGQHDLAIATLEQARPLLARMRARKEATGDRDEFVLESMVGRAYLARKQYERAIAHHRRQLAISMDNLQKDKNSVLCYYDLSAAHEQLAKALIEAGLADQSKPHVEGSLQAIAQAEKIDSTSTMTVAHRNSAMRTEALLYTALKNDAAAEAAYHRIVAQNEASVRKMPTPGMKEELVKRYKEAVDFHRAQAMKGRDRQRHLFEIHRFLTLEIEVQKQLKDDEAVAELQKEVQQLRASTSH
ncbi:MAG: serine/threonine protein kinase [Acidobacteria bacterium]|nr:serine/threonine protein kinase [Acidobacteriota bacterium]